jgi:peptidoglycan hydrolase FlgJ
MINSYDISGQLAIDSQNIEKLRHQSKQDPEAGLQQVAKQFEALFVNMMLKSMREATPQQGLFDSEQSRFYTQMLDQQLAQNLADKGIGLAEMIVQQLAQDIDESAQPDSAIGEAGSLMKSIANNNNAPLITLAPGQQKDLPSQLWTNAGHSAAKPTFSGVTPAVLNERLATIKAGNTVSSIATTGQPREFVSEMLPHARRVAKETGIPERFMIAQAALETGWGKHQIRREDNHPSFNLFGIKAGKNWQGKVVEAITTEYIEGKPQKVTEKFRAYNSYEEAFRDYASLLQNNPRYAAVLKSRSATAFAWGLQQAGYATDPQYADKLIKIIESDALSMNKYAG